MSRSPNPRPPRAVLEDVYEVERMLREIRARYSHAYDLAYSSGGGGVAAGGGRGDLQYSDPTQAAAIAGAKDGTRYDVERASKAVAKMVKEAHVAHAALVQAMPGADPYEPSWKASDADAIATRAERAQTAQRQAERIARGEM